ncbi:calcium-binding protein [Aliiroseovarius sp. KMU-50]|uniref:Calcium-binding protein n=1 Tax=Aliiroseovarius salicola TaxID=3009082 RepID=A0ABT4VYX0_9RHOB|nr:calcium-binding protein [Aliiroseovarius sp. KMU-50]MDA5092733.1 calcium-binding protein [Aliiroseovarius sp. KMU-50]
MILGLLFLGLVPAAFLADGFFEGPEEVEPDEAYQDPDESTLQDVGDFISGSVEADSGTDKAESADKANSNDDPDIDDVAEDEDVVGDILNPVDQPSEGLPSGPDATLLDNLLSEQSDAIYGLSEYENVSRDADPMLLGDGDDEFTGSSDGEPSEGALDLFYGTPLIQLEEEGLVGVIDGQGGNDTIATGDDASFAFGGNGDDQITVGAAPAAVFGGDGDDKIIGAYTADHDELSGYLDGGDGNDTIVGGDGVDLIFGGEHDGMGTGKDDDVLSGGGGADQISGGYGSDLLDGDAGNDVLDHLGHAMEDSGAERSNFDWHIDNDSDTLDGGEGNDTLIFDRADVATGGAGADTFHMYFDHDTGEGHANVTDFVSGEDFLRVTLNPDTDPGAIDLDVSTSANGEDAVVTVDGEVVAVLQGAPNATLTDIRVEIMTEAFA